MSTRAQAITQATQRLVACGLDADEAQDDARALLRAAGVSRLDLALSPQEQLSDEQAQKFAHSLDRRAAREPVSRIIGARGFWSLDLVVAPHVLDPRADTESLIETVLALLGDRRQAPLSILDLGAGSGAITCALLSELPAAQALAVDLSPQACAAAAENIARCGFADRAQVTQGRWGAALTQRFDVIVSNPPYIRSGDIATLDPEVRLHDPALALDGGPDGLECYREIIGDAPRLLTEGGLLAVEIGADQAADVAALMTANGFALERISQDLGGRDRVVAGRLAQASS